MDHTAIPEPVGFSGLSKVEQIRFIQALWDRIAEQPDDLPMPEWHLDLAEQRLADYQRGPTRARSAYDILDDPMPESRCILEASRLEQRGG